MRKILLLLILISVILGGCGTKDNSSDVNGNDKKTAEEVQTDEKQNEQQEPSDMPLNITE